MTIGSNTGFGSPGNCRLHAQFKLRWGGLDCDSGRPGYTRMLNIVDEFKKKTPGGEGWKEVKWAEDHEQEASLDPCLKRWTTTSAGRTMLKGKELKRMKELNRMGSITKKLIGQKYKVEAHHAGCSVHAESQVGW